MKIYVDLDDVIADTMATLLTVAKTKFDRSLVRDEIQSFDLQESFSLDSAQYAAFFDFIHLPAILLSIEPIPAAVEVIRGWLFGGAAIVVATGRPDYTVETSRRWLDRNGLQGASLISVDKYNHSKGNRLCHAHVHPLCDVIRMNFDVAIEDSPSTVKALSANGGMQVLLMDQPWNRKVTFEKAVTRAKDWGEIQAFVASANRNGASAAILP